MKESIKRLVLAKNDRGRWLWAYPLYASLHDLRRYPIRRFVNLLRHLLPIWRGRRAPFSLPPGFKTSVFYLSRGTRDGVDVIVKIPRLDNRHAHAFASCLRTPENRQSYRALLEELPHRSDLGRHVARVLNVEPDGGYTSAFVKGHNLALLRDRILEQRALPDDLEPGALLAAIEALQDALSRFGGSGESGLRGDWALQNLIFEAETSTIKNVDLEGFFTYEDGRLEASREFVLAELGTIRNLVALIGREAPGSESILDAVAALRDAATSDVSYSGRAYSAGYHSVSIGGLYFRGQRECASRLAEVPYRFEGKTVLDLGCNTGGMLHCLAERLERGIGLDLDPRSIVAARKIQQVNRADNLAFHEFDLNRRSLDEIVELLPHGSADVAFLLSVCMWLDRPKEVIDWIAQHCPALLLETNGNRHQQERQVGWARDRYESVHLIRSSSTDDPGQRKRALYLCRRSEAIG